MELEKPDGQMSDFNRNIASKASRKLKAQRKKDRSLWTGVKMFGLVGWSVATPTLLGAALGAWLDKRYPGPHSWTLTLLLIGIISGCINAWYWVQKESKAIHRDMENDE